jgi:hypothetical protein
MGKAKKNAAGRIIAAIEGDYALPVTYVQEQEKKQHAAREAESKKAADDCSFCDTKGWRRIVTHEYPAGVMKRCSHDPDVEAKYSEAGS